MVVTVGAIVTKTFELIDGEPLEIHFKDCDVVDIISMTEYCNELDRSLKLQGFDVLSIDEDIHRIKVINEVKV